MEYRKLEELMNLKTGKNATRLKDSTDDIYTPDDFENDFNEITLNKKISACVISLMTSKAAPLLERKNQKCITSNFLICNFDEEKLDPWYFCYLFNESKYIEQQIAMMHQGSTLSVKKLTIKNVSELTIPIHSIEQQRKIGQLYHEAIVKKNLMQKQVDDVSALLMEIIRKIEED